MQFDYKMISDPADVLYSFIDDQDMKDTSRTAYHNALKQFYSWVAGYHKTLNELEFSDLVAWKDQTLDEDLSSLTVRSYINAIKQFYKWLEANRYYPNIAASLKSPRVSRNIRRKPFTLIEARSILWYVKNVKKKNRDRDYAMLALFLQTGLRSEELCNANIGDLDVLQGKNILWVLGKGYTDKDQYVIIAPRLHKILKDYIELRRLAGTAEPTQPLFLSNKGGRLTTRGIRHLTKAVLTHVGLYDKNHSTHSFRHTTAVNILRSGGSLEQVQQTLRHSDISTSMIYTQVMDEERRMAQSGEDLIDGVLE